jgi:RNA polymerase sigma factor (sigma-70 family)
MHITDKDYKRYKRMAIVITSGNVEEAEDLLQDVLLKFCEKETDDEKLTDNYIFISLKNKFIDGTKKIKNNIEFEDYQNINISDEDDDEFIERLNKENKDWAKLQQIKNNISKLNHFEKMLFELVVIKDIKQIRIAEKTGLSKSLISARFQEIKNKLKDGK